MVGSSDLCYKLKSMCILRIPPPHTYTVMPTCGFFFFFMVLFLKCFCFPSPAPYLSRDSGILNYLWNFELFATQNSCLWFIFLAFMLTVLLMFRFHLTVFLWESVVLLLTLDLSTLSDTAGTGWILWFGIWELVAQLCCKVLALSPAVPASLLFSISLIHTTKFKPLPLACVVSLSLHTHTFWLF